MGGKRGRLISLQDREQAVALVKEASASGARKHKACELLNIALRTIERWEKRDGTKDKRSSTIKISQVGDGLTLPHFPSRKKRRKT